MRSIPFPPQSIGFLFYYRDPDAAPLEGSIRFRVVPQNTPTTFHDGHDLLLPSGRPWQITLPQIACRAQYARIRAQLLQEKLATAEQLAQCLKCLERQLSISAQIDSQTCNVAIPDAFFIYAYRVTMLAPTYQNQEISLTPLRHVSFSSHQLRIMLSELIVKQPDDNGNKANESIGQGNEASYPSLLISSSALRLPALNSCTQRIRAVWWWTLEIHCRMSGLRAEKEMASSGDADGVFVDDEHR
ncbi:hypothetical protein K438DRAFT_1783727 [Mycena galopus ATCC 62051]|nr:hypothetical protein K438DRAFT_1783727 [Mycena galopus ATCC 62051]